MLLPVDAEEPFSARLEAWLRSDGPKTIGALSEVIEERTFAVVLLVLMLVPALPAPTGGVTHVFEVIAVLVTIQMIVGRRTLWLPRRFLARDLGAASQEKVIPFLVRRVAWLERFARPRFAGLLNTRLAVSAIGAVALVLVLGAFLAPPFSGLDTLPSLGVVIISLGLILDDGLFIAAGTVVGAAGVVLEIVLGAALYRGLGHLI
jgi:hypothetical protein